MNMILLEPTDWIAADTVRLTDRRWRHWRDVLRQRHGDLCQVGLLDGAIGTGEAVAVADDAVTLRVVWDRPPPPPVPLQLFLALPRPKTMRKVLHAAVSFGVKSIWFFHTWKVEKSYWQSPMLTDGELQAEVRLALEQAVDTVPPRIEFRPRFKPFVEDELPTLWRGTQVWLAHPGSAAPCPFAPGGNHSLVLGPEGGFTAYEAQQLIRAGATPVHLGARILRTEVALSALLGRLA